jgi:hypothetical protein
MESVKPLISGTATGRTDSPAITDRDSKVNGRSRGRRNDRLPPRVKSAKPDYADVRDFLMDRARAR